ncbi:MAG: hypothetical protein GY874_21060 [Desulfobacteraceae bacterium]|nr:hypothetical protein [Desulfobacteraceae bacterium]
MVTDPTQTTSVIFLRAVLPVMKVLLTDDPGMQKKFSSVNTRILFTAKQNGGLPMAAWVGIDKGDFTINFDTCENPDITFAFSSLDKMNAFFSGKPVLPKISGWWRFGLLMKVISLLMGLKILMPGADPKNPEKRRLKVKMTFYMITTALSQYNKSGDPEMVKWTSRQPERIYQFSVDDSIAAYLRVKAGKSKAGRGFYKRRRPFVHMRFNGVEGAYPIIMNRIDMVDAVRKGHLAIEGSPEYAGNMGDFMMRIQELIT